MDTGTGSVGFFEGLSFLGWVGVAIWFAFILIVFIKKEWMFYFDERFPKLEAFERFGYLPEQQYIFMTIRFFVLGMLFYIVGQVLILI